MSTAPSVERPRTIVSPAVPATPDCPYVGPSPFLSSDSQRFFGRDREAVDLKHRVMAHPITVLYAMSGAGKTSLINARLIPDLQSEGCRVLPSARVRGSSWKLDPAEIPNIYVFHTVICWQSQCDAQTTGRLKNRTLKDETGSHGDTRRRQRLALDRGLRPVRRALHGLFQPMGRPSGIFRTALRCPEVDPEPPSPAGDARGLPGVVGPLCEPGAGEPPDAVPARAASSRSRSGSDRQAAEDHGTILRPGVADKLLDSLMTIHVRPQRDTSRTSSDNEDADLLSTTAGPRPATRCRRLPADLEGYCTTSEYVEPVQLQVVCQNLWYNLRPEEVEITAAHLESRGDVNQALARFYEELREGSLEWPACEREWSAAGSGSS